MICIRSFLQEIRFLSLSYWWWCLFMFPLESPFPFFILHVHLCYELNDFLFCFSLVVFDGLIITSLRVFVNTFLCFYAIIFIYLFCYVFIFYNLFVFFYYFLLIYAIVKLWRTGWYVANGRAGRVRLRRSSASKAAGILLKPLKKSQNSLTLKQLGFFQQRSLPAA